MTADRWRLLESIYLDGQRLSAEERAKLLEERASTDPGLQSEVRALWREHESEESFLQNPAARLDASPHAFTEGQTLAERFTIVAFLGAGGMGEVYKAVDSRLERTVAIKVLPRSLIQNRQHRVRLEKEARALSQLNHHGICALHDLCWEDGQPLLIMEHIEGQTLAARLLTGAPPMPEALSIARQIADALIYSHERGVIHQDLKPGNIMLTAHGVKLLDFGLARRLSTSLPGPEGSEVVTADHAVRGTPGYMSPEQVKGQPADARSDIFSFGSLLFETLTCRRAFRATSSITTIAAVLHVDPPPVSQIAPGVPSGLEHIVERCLRKDPDQRWQHMNDVKEALEEVWNNAAAFRAVSKPGIAKFRRALWALPAAAVLAAGFWLVIQSRRPISLPPAIARPLPGEGRVVKWPSFSPDGNQFVYAGEGDVANSLNLFVRFVGGGSSLQLTSGDVQDISSVWSPDGNKIAFLRRTSNTDATLLLISPLGGPPRKVVDLRIVDFAVLNIWNFLSWTPDSEHLIVSEKSGPSSPVRLLIVSVDSGEKRVLTDPPQSSLGDVDPAVSPDGRTLAFVRMPVFGVAKLHLLPLENDTKPTEVVTGLRFISAPTWLPDGRSLLVKESGETERSTLWRISPFGSNAPEPMSFIQDSVAYFLLSRNNRLVYVRELAHFDIWKVSVGRGKTEIGPIVTSSYLDTSPNYSPDGRRIAFSSNRTGDFQIWACNGDGANLVQLTNVPSSQIGGRPRWSPDGKFISFHVRVDGKSDIYTVSEEGGASQRLTKDSVENAGASWSRDGSVIYFGSNRTGRFQIYKMPSTGGVATQLTKEGGVSPVESYDGNFLIYLKNPGLTDVWRVPVRGGVEERLFGPIFYLNLAVGANDLFHLAYSQAKRRFAIRSFPLIPGVSSAAKTRDVVDLGPEFAVGLSALSDGSSFLYSKHSRERMDLMMVENFR
ncbi:MAG: protein kinase domain-containing protein [Bryobacteraceae bacterium]